MKVPRATYRIQFHSAFTFHDAAVLADYLAELGVSHLYASPYLQAVPGSTHGYDVVDPGKINRELGGEMGHQKLCEALTAQGLRQVLDVVPNHMAILGQENAWWWDVLENGPSSSYADYFDVDWNPPEERMSNKILIPLLGDHYGRIIEAGEIRLAQEKGEFTFQYHEHRFPVDPRSLADLLHQAARRVPSFELDFYADALRCFPLPTATDKASVQRRHRDKEVIGLHLRRLFENSPEIMAAVDEAVQEVNASPDILHDLLEEQNYRLAYWRSASRDLGYRRFFDINSLVGLRAEEERVFNDTHRLILRWLRDGVLDGLRIDHPDGLRDPEQYLRRLREASPAWIVVEKILHHGERLPASWPVQGTTGYDFMNLLGGLFISQGAEGLLTDLYREFTGQEPNYLALAREKKHIVMHSLLASDISRLTELAMKICERNRSYRDYTRYEVNEAIREVIACFPVYRTYMKKDGAVRDQDRIVVLQAVEAAKTLRSEIDPVLFDFIRKLLLFERRGDLEMEFVMRFQQTTGPITAKGIEDTAFYCYNRFVALNEVGGDPAHFGVSVDEFHRAMAEASSTYPHAMRSTSTHDTKRSEDVRARLAILSEIPDLWIEAVYRWSSHNERHRKDNLPDRNTEYLLYQTLVGAWPIERERVSTYMEKAAREAKVHTSWNRPDPAYEERMLGFIESVLGDEEFLRDLEGFVAPLVKHGRVNSLSQALIKATAPGVPDFYQGTELWDLSMVDPDNRRPVDYELRRRLLRELEHLSPEDIVNRDDEGLPKLWVTKQALALRRRSHDLFALGNYQPVVPKGQLSEHVVAFIRADRVFTLVPRLCMSLGGDWRDTAVELPDGWWENVLTGEKREGGDALVGDLLRRFPVALLFLQS